MKIPKQHEQALVRYFQEGHSRLAADGIYGPKTATALDRYLVPGSFPMSPMRRAFLSAMDDVGKGEEPRGSNSGAYVKSLRDQVHLPRRAGGEWCAVFVSAHLNNVGINAKSRGAPGVCRALANLQGGRYVDLHEIGGGFVGLALRKRGALTHHVQMFSVSRGVGGLVVRHVGGNEKHEVQSKIWSLSGFMKGVKKVVTYE